MAQFTHENADNYGGSLQGGFFGLKNDKDKAFIRYMYNSINEVVGHSVHEIEVNGKKRYIECLREYNQPVEDCPLCLEKYKLFAKLFVKVYDTETDEAKIWDRGKTYFDVLAGLSARYSPLVSTVFEVERNGKKGDNQTKYMNYPCEPDETTLEDLPEMPDVLGTLILDKTYDEIMYYLETGEFEDNGNDAPPFEADTRQPDRRPAQQGSRPAPAGRQAPANRPEAPAGRQAPAGNPPAAPAGQNQRRTPANSGAPARGRGGNSTDRF